MLAYCSSERCQNCIVRQTTCSRLLEKVGREAYLHEALEVIGRGPGRNGRCQITEPRRDAPERNSRQSFEHLKDIGNRPKVDSPGWVWFTAHATSREVAKSFGRRYVL